MALALSMRVGHDLYIGDHKLVIDWIESPFRFGVSLGDGRKAVLNQDSWTEIYPGVTAQAGVPRNQNSQKIVSLVVTAPGIKITRGSLMRRGNGDPDSCLTCKGTKELFDKVACSKCLGFGCDVCKQSGYVGTAFKCPDC